MPVVSAPMTAATSGTATCSSNSSGSSNFSGKMSTSTAPQMFKDAYVRRAKLK